MILEKKKAKVAIALKVLPSVRIDMERLLKVVDKTFQDFSGEMLLEYMPYKKRLLRPMSVPREAVFGSVSISCSGHIHEDKEILTVRISEFGIEKTSFSINYESMDTLHDLMVMFMTYSNSAYGKSK